MEKNPGGISLEEISQVKDWTVAALASMAALAQLRGPQDTWSAREPTEET